MEEYSDNARDPEKPEDQPLLDEKSHQQKQHHLYSTASTEHMELMEAHRTLIEQHFIDAGQREFYLVRSYQRALQDWHTKHTGWHLENYQGVFHLQSIPSAQPPFQDMKGLLHPHDLAYLFWILWYAADGHARHYAPT